MVQVAATPSDTRFAEQWALQNTGQTGGTPGADIDAVAAWDLTTGSSQVVVAVLDTGVDARHPDLKGAIEAYHRGAHSAKDLPGHGTHVAGIIAALANNVV